MDIGIHRVTSIELKNVEGLKPGLGYTRKIVIKSNTIENEPTETTICLFGSKDDLDVLI